MTQLNATFGSGGMSCEFSDSQLTSFVHFLQRQCSEACSHDNWTAATQRCVGVQPHCANQLTIGEVISSDEAKYVWIEQTLLEDKYNKKSKIPREDLTAEINTPLANDINSFLRNLAKLMNKYMKHNFISSVVLMGGSVMLFNFASIAKTYGGCPIPIAIRPPQTGKTTAIRTGLSLAGVQESSYYVKGTKIFFFGSAPVSRRCHAMKFNT